jgi:UDP-N-acetylglucosamine 2-epimerase (non-hydrolysing)
MVLKILSVVGARPNFIKIAAICEAINGINSQGIAQIQHVLVHTGQHYDTNMSDSFFNDLELPKPDLSLGVGSGSHSVQTAKIMERFESVVLNEQPHLVLVVGDVNSTAACALVAKKTWCRRGQDSLEFIPKLAHIEAGLRSFDRTMPEEINRIVTDSISDYLFTTEESANQNLLREGIPENRIFFVGNVMIDTLLRHRSKAQESTILQDLQLADGRKVKPYAILTLHRPANVDDKQVFSNMLEAFLEISQSMPVIFPAHPRTLKRIQEADLGDYFVDHFVQGPEPWDSRVRIRLVPPLGYLDFLRLMSEAKIVLTDSGGIQEETTILGVPCITLRDSTERPVTLENGGNVLVGANSAKIITEFDRLHRNEQQAHRSPRYWDGHAAKRIINLLVDEFSSDQSSAMARCNLESEFSRVESKAK